MLDVLIGTIGGAYAANGMLDLMASSLGIVICELIVFGAITFFSYAKIKEVKDDKRRTALYVVWAIVVISIALLMLVAVFSQATASVAYWR